MVVLLFIVLVAFAVGYLVGQADTHVRLKRRLIELRHDPEFKEAIMKAAFEEMEREVPTEPAAPSKWALKIQELQRLQDARKTTSA